jgi:hypothetical protein
MTAFPALHPMTVKTLTLKALQLTDRALRRRCTLP